MAVITFPDKNTGENLLASEVNEIKSVVNTNGQFTEVLSAQSVVDQAPTALGVPLQIEFGAAQFGASDPVQLLANGDININQSGLYWARVLLSVGRVKGNGVSKVFLRGGVSGDQIGNPAAIELDDADAILTLQYSLFSELPSSTVLTFDIARDPAGFNDGLLRSLAPTGSIASWGASSSASIRIFKVQ